MRYRRHIIALGGGGFSLLNDDPKLCSYILEQSGRDTPRVCFIPTAAGDSELSVACFYKAAKRLGAKPSHLSLFSQPRQPLAKFVPHHDVIYVGGGNTRNMLLLWKAWGLDEILRSAYERGIVFAGNSAGALCWFGGGVTDSYPGRPLRRTEMSRLAPRELLPALRHRTETKTCLSEPHQVRQAGWRFRGGR